MAAALNLAFFKLTTQVLTAALPPFTRAHAPSQYAFVFVGGFPRSGTSLVHQLLITNSTSGMESCLPNCAGSSMEGQWLLAGPDKYPLSALGPGEVLSKQAMTEARNIYKGVSLASKSALTGSEADQMRQYLWGSWTRYWWVTGSTFPTTAPHLFCGLAHSLERTNTRQRSPIPTNARQYPPTPRSQGHDSARAGREITVQSGEDSLFARPVFGRAAGPVRPGAQAPRPQHPLLWYVTLRCVRSRDGEQVGGCQRPPAQAIVQSDGQPPAVRPPRLRRNHTVLINH